ncbi:MAG: LON peptidase substrate-binding domain-containing protein, partial [Eubacterium sp.]|nr:LON peptidase substrate-binding domain-containing protein [Eubacterium sp.]
MSDTVLVLPTVALRGVTILPGMVIHFEVSREKSIRAIEQAMVKDDRVFLVTQREISVMEPTLDDLYTIGTISVIKQVVRLPKGSLRILAEGQERAELLDFEEAEEMLQSKIEVLDTGELQPIDDVRSEAMLRNLKGLFSAYAGNGQNITRDLFLEILDIDSLDKLVDQICINIPVPWEKQQRLLGAADLQDRYEILCDLLANEAEIERIRAELKARVKARIDKNQKEYILRE